MVDISRLKSLNSGLAMKTFTKCFGAIVGEVGMAMALSGLASFLVALICTLKEDKKNRKYLNAFLGDFTKTLEDNGIVSGFIIPVDNSKKKRFGGF